MPLEHPEKLFAEWKAVYGDIIFLRLFNTPTVVLNTQSAAKELLERRGTKYSNRPNAVWMTEMLKWDANAGTMQAGETHRKHRRWAQAPLFDKASLEKFLPVQIREMYTLLGSLLKDPEDFAAHFHRFSGSVLLDALYGHSVSAKDDRYLALIDKALDGVTGVSAPGAALVDFIPILQHIPSWFPGAWWKRLALETRIALKESSEKTYLLAESTDDDKYSIVGSLIREHKENGTLVSEAYEIKMFGTTMYVAGTDTTKTVMQSFILAMVLHPEVFLKAQKEMDNVVGHDRLPTIDDRGSLPYLECVLKETYRWAPPIPVGIPHATSEDDEYRGYYIPKGTTIIPNIWLMLRDPEEYPEPDSFIPDRFWGLSSAESDRIDPKNLVFGYGRRICPGRRFADISVWLAAANIVATFDIHKARDGTGKEITPVIEFESGLSSPPVPFKCSIKPRSQQSVELIMNVL
ncbi:cytochrome P450 [Daedalea quercina L-15889]|uniref:Cytochrome P450 n=1 Tax=Daedalea quercina L-15889 TaxID=1314783 RepID=A0A165QF04_9APHY|nr:cytochrome P450 [Daedalea quercina L-15889]